MSRQQHTRRCAFTVPLPKTAAFYPERYPGCTHVLTCTKCGVKRYTDGRLQGSIEKLERLIARGELDPVEEVLPRHKPCDAPMTLEALDATRR